MPVIKVNPLDSRLFASLDRLAKRAASVYSQHGEDGVLAAIFETIGARNKWCVEIGAWDGVYLSNTCNLIRHHGWNAVLFERDPKRCAEIAANHVGKPVTVFNEQVGFEPGVDSIETFLARTDLPRDFDVISIDIDGADWHLWDSMVDYRPRVVVIEFNYQVPNHVVFIQDRDMSLSEGCSLSALIELGKSKGYELVFVDGTNAIFVLREDFGLFGIADNNIDAMNASANGAVWSAYNGKLYHTLPRLGWYGKNLPLPPDRLQVLAEFRHANVAQGRSSPVPAIDLETAEGILREVFTLRDKRREIDEAEWAERNKKAWAAAKAYAIQVR